MKPRLKPALWVLCAIVFLCSNACVSRRITFVGTGDLQGLLDPFEAKIDADGDGNKEKRLTGGISRLGTSIRTIKSENQGGVIVVSPGDDLMNRYFHTFKGEAIYRLMSMAGYEVYAFGNHEFDKGPDVLAKALTHASFQIVCSDLDTVGTPLEGLCLPVLIKEYNGVKVGFFSLMTEDFPLVTKGGDVRITGTNIEAARKSVVQLRNQGAQIIAGITHIGIENDRKVARAVNGIDVIFGSHSHDYLDDYAREGDTLIVNGGEKGTFLVRLDIVVKPDGKIAFDQTKFQLIPVTDDIPGDTEIDKILTGYRESMPEAVDIGTTQVEWHLGKDVVRMGESTVADLVNDLMREKFKADIVLNNAGSFRGKQTYPSGPITDAMLKEIDEFGNTVFLLDLKGKHIREILERSAACFGEGGFLHPSGLRYAMDIRKPAQSIGKDESGKLNVLTQGQRITEIKLVRNGELTELEPEKNYRVLTNAYLANNQGDGYFWFSRFGENLNNTYSTFYSILEEAAGAGAPLNPPKPDGRIKVSR